MIVDLQPEYMGIFGMSKEEKIYKTLRKTFPDITLNTVKNLLRVFNSAVKQLKTMPTDSIKKTQFVNYIHNQTGINSNIIAVFIDRLNDSIESGSVNIKEVNPEISKSKWQYYVYPVLGVAGLIALSILSSNVKTFAQLRKVSS